MIVRILLLLPHDDNDSTRRCTLSEINTLYLPLIIELKLNGISGTSPETVVTGRKNTRRDGANDKRIISIVVPSHSALLPTKLFSILHSFTWFYVAAEPALSAS